MRHDIKALHKRIERIHQRRTESEPIEIRYICTWGDGTPCNEGDVYTPGMPEYVTDWNVGDIDNDDSEDESE